MVYNITLLVGNDSLVKTFLCEVKPVKKSFSLLSCLHLLKLGNQLSFDFWAFSLRALRAIAFEVI